MKYSNTDGKEWDIPDQCPFCELDTGGNHKSGCPNYVSKDVIWREFLREKGVNDSK